MKFSIIIPAYNEDKRLGPTLEKIWHFMESKNAGYEIIVVDDGSGDRTSEVARGSDASKNGKLSVLSNPGNKGKGYSVRNGIGASKGEYVLITDADLSTPIEEMDKLWDHVAGGFDIVIGSRSITDSDVTKRQPWYREIMGKTFNKLVRTLVINGFNDTQCGFKLVKGSVARELARKMCIDGFCFDVEMLFLAKKMGCRIKETGVIWRNSPESTVRLMDSSLRMFLDLFIIRRIHA